MGAYLIRQQAAFVLKNMKVIGAYMLAVVGGNASPSVADCKKILSSMDISLDGDAEKRLTDFVEEMAGKDINEVMALAMRSSRPSPWAAVAVVAAAVLPLLLAVMPPQLLPRRSPPPTMVMPVPPLLASSTMVV